MRLRRGGGQGGCVDGYSKEVSSNALLSGRRTGLADKVLAR